ncbi:hypothetical protein MASR2M15_06960 [Anaerolineales bacterium]
MTDENAIGLLRWIDPITGESCQRFLYEGETLSIGRGTQADIQIPEQHVSRLHARLRYDSGMFVIEDLESANGTFVGDEQITEAYPLMAGDTIRLFVPLLEYRAVVDDKEQEAPASFKLEEMATAPVPHLQAGEACLVIVNGTQSHQIVPLIAQEVTIGRAVTNAQWDILIEDASISRPHCRLEKRKEDWWIFDLGGTNGTFINEQTAVDPKAGYRLTNGDMITLGLIQLRFHHNV